MHNGRRQYFIIAFIVLTGSLFFNMLAGIGFAWETKDPQLAEDFAAMLGYKVKEKVGIVAPEITPGMVIDGENYLSSPGLKELLPGSLYRRLDPGSYAPLAPLKIVKTDHYHLGRGWLEKSVLSAKTAHIADDGLTLEGYVGGHPFIHPASGVELIQWAENAYLGDTIALRPMRMLLYGHGNKPEREMRQQVNFLRYMNCTDWREDIRPNPENLHYVVSGTFIYPRDISGTAYVRRRYLPSDKPDEFLLYVCSMRRVRRMSSRDTQDPLFGSDIIWDDYNGFWQKISPTDFPNKYLMLPSKEMLLPSFVDYDWPQDRALAGFTDWRVDESDGGVYLRFGSWQRRWVHVCEVISKDSAYCYSRRVIVNEPETCVQLQGDTYDQAGRLWRSGIRDYNLSRDGVGIMEDLGEIVDFVNNHRTIVDFKGYRNPQWMGTDYADVRFLSRKAR
ncbi:MAG: DUF1329 domain-containing protein [Deltaproteobacteria bacterium]|nr:DUF1329 domain-containing protein [Deltaproteobacteria bacterium]